MKRTLIATVGLLAALLNCSAQDQKPESEELNVLEHFAGTWEIDLRVKPVGGEEFKSEVISHRSWSKGGSFIRFEEPATVAGPEFQMLMTYDPKYGNYPGVMMSGPLQMEITGTWDEKSKTMSFESTSPDGNLWTSTHKFVGKDRAEARGVVKSPDDELVMEISWNQTRCSDKPLGKAPSTDEMIVKYQEAIGGLAANKKITTRRIDGKLTLPGAPQSFEITSIAKAPDLVHTKVVVPGFGNSFEGSDGKVAWKSNPSDGTVEFEGDERAQKLRDSNFHRYVDLKSDFEKLESQGRETVGGMSFDVLVGTRDSGISETLYFDARTHRLAIVKRDGTVMELSDYDEVDGIAFARTISLSTQDGAQLLTIEIESVEQGVEVDEAFFAKPE